MKSVKKAESKSARREMAERLKRMQEKLGDVLETVHDGFFALDRNWRYVYANPTVERYERAAKDELIGEVIWERFPKAKNTLFFKKYHEAMETGKEIEFDEMIDNKWFDIHVVPVEDGIWVFYRDITAHKLADERKDEFIRMASHELKTPITSLKLYAELLEQMIPDSEAKEYLKHINEQADKLTKLISEMLDLSRIQLGKIEFNKKELDLVEIVKGLIPELQAATSHRLELRIEPKHAPVYADKMRLTQVITNLVENAVKYSPGKDRVVISLKKDRRRVYLEIQDFGVGIEPAYLDKIFDRFYQATGTKGRAFPGLGVGLYISKMMVEAHHGEIKVESQVGKGSTFTLALPVYQRNSRRHGRKK